MASTFTPNIQLQEPAAGDQVGTWGTVTVNPNMTLIDLVAGANTTVSLNNSNVVLSASQFQSRMVTFNSTLTGSVIITFPTSFTKDYKVRNLCTGSSAFTVTLETTASGGQVIACPPGDTVDVYNDGTNLIYTNLGHIGSYWDYAGSSVPAWVSACTVPPWLPCVGGTFSGTTYPQLAVILGGTTLPDSRGRVRAFLDQGAGRLSSVLTSSTVGAAGGDQNLQSHTHNNTLSDPGHVHQLPTNILYQQASGELYGSGIPPAITSAQNTVSAQTGISINNVGTGTGSGQNVQPTYMGGLTLIRGG